MEYAIDVRRLSKSFQGNKVLKGIDLRVKRGELFALLGPNGAGKTTTINILSTLLKADSGTAIVAGYDVGSQGSEVRKLISLTGQFASLDEGLTGMQNLQMVAKLNGYSSRDAQAIAEDSIRSFGLWEAKDRMLGNYSGGMRRRLDIAASIVTQPELIFLDEPTTGLDPQSRIQVWEVVRMLLGTGTTIVLTTQYLEEADQLANRIAVIDQGRIIAEGTPAQLKASIGGKTLSLQLSESIDIERLEGLLADLSMKVYQEDNPLIYKIVVQEARMANEALQRLLSHDVPVEYFTLGEPSLDEVFLSLTNGNRKEVVL